MEEDTICPVKVPTSPFCRICIGIKNVRFDLYETISEDSGKLSMHGMLVKLFPSMFNVEQVANDEIMSRPDRICQQCKYTVTEAYHLYNQCLTSTERLEKLLAVEEVVLDETETKIFAESEDENNLVMQDKVSTKSRKIAKSSIVMNVEDSPSRILKLRSTKNLKRSEATLQSTTPQDPSRQALPKGIQDTKKRKTKALIEAVAEDDCLDATANTRDDQSPVASDDSVIAKGEIVDLQLTAPSTNKETVPNGHDQKKNKRVRGSHLSRVKAEKQAKSVPEMAENITEELEQSDEPETKIDLYRCQLCEGPTYTSPTDLTDHLKKAHADLISSCDKCPKVFMNEQAFQHHQYCHAIGRSHFCMFCDKGFVTEELLRGHVRTHTHRTDYLCFLCGKEFSNSSNLRQHVKRHYGEKPFTCDQCPMRFSTKGYLTRHQQTHTKIKKFTCDTCGSLFSRQYTLVKHQLLHTGARYFSCEVCKMSFTSSDHVKRHMRTHTGEKPYKCGCCGRAFAQSNDMVKHMRTHLGDNAYQCDRCNASYRLLSELRSHYKEHYKPGDNPNGCSSVEEEKEIRFTSMNILNRLFDKKPEQYSE